ncbi:hypothetical protein SI859A1_02494 [Aurantimonas manganoxydans SI85-9A1]|uniref:Uncharacterized protein n=1 Tax=Aurantimonas manganoxydans (strain ATCC BAA-1229 / DSM 21871 / SI85-9A1) TaxID=287752 RepID=Q1YLQ3_AURMS|nr:hypothetical protein SI859A1_02494 [Aurantimonas manganoxydans SI85-9A1]
MALTPPKKRMDSANSVPPRNPIRSELGSAAALLRPASDDGEPDADKTTSRKAGLQGTGRRNWSGAGLPIQHRIERLMLSAPPVQRAQASPSGFVRLVQAIIGHGRNPESRQS